MQNASCVETLPTRLYKWSSATKRRTIVDSIKFLELIAKAFNKISLSMDAKVGKAVLKPSNDQLYSTFYKYLRCYKMS